MVFGELGIKFNKAYLHIDEDDRTSRDSKINLFAQKFHTTFISDLKPLMDFLLKKENIN